MTNEEIIDRLDDLAEKYNQRRARYWASSEEHSAMRSGSKIDRRNALSVAYTQELLAHEAKAAMMDLAALAAEARGLVKGGGQ